MNLNELMKTTPDELRKLQHKELKSHAINVLQSIIDNIKQDNYERIREKLEFSPSGDGYGCDNSYINFDYGNGSIDMSGVVDYLESLSSK